jgi:spore coat protein H
MRIRGDGSRVLPKKSLKVKLDIGTFPDGKTTYNFNAEYEDISYMQQYIASHLFHKSGHHCFNTEHVRLYLNDEFLGLYLSVENMDEDFLSARNLDPNGGLYKAKIDGASLSIYDNVYYHWDINAGNTNFNNLIDIIDLFDNTSIDNYYHFANEFLDYDKMINILAVNLLLRNYSSYYHNYFMYHDVNNSGKWTMLPWDLDKVFL